MTEILDRQLFSEKKSEIHNALAGNTGIVNGVSDENQKDIFYMLCFCLSVPQSKAIQTEKAIQILRNKDFFAKSLSKAELSSIFIRYVRFHNKKSSYLYDARNIFFEIWEELKSTYSTWNKIDFEKKKQYRDYIASRFNGLSFKESSHFLRNIGMRGLAILDRHIVNAMIERNILHKDFVLSSSNYSSTEKKMLEYANKVGLSIEELDLMFWSFKTGFVFK